MAIRWVTELGGIGPEHLEGFFEGWPDPPSPATHRRILAASHEFVLAVDDESGRVVGFVTAITDGVLSAYVPLLEVLPAWRGRGIASELVRRLVARLADLYMIDLTCDPDVQPFYERLGFRPSTGMMIRRYDRQSGRKTGAEGPETPDFGGGGDRGPDPR
jgi:GNAT superfamily N-acetyltransferase